MDSRDVGILAVVVAGGLAIGWASGDGAVMPSPSGTSPAAAESVSAAQSQSGVAGAPAEMPPPANRTSEGEQLDSAVQARAQSAFQSGTAGNGASIPTMPVPPPTTAGATSGASWGGQSAAPSGSGWGGQGTSSGWGVQAGVAPASPAQAPAPAQPASPSAAADQQPAE